MTTNNSWLAGAIDFSGSFLVVRTPGLTPYAVRYVARSSKHTEALTRFASMVGANITRVKQGDQIASQVVLQGQPLHRMMTSVWDELSTQRKAEYARARRAMRKLNEEVKAA